MRRFSEAVLSPGTAASPPVANDRGASSKPDDDGGSEPSVTVFDLHPAGATNVGNETPYRGASLQELAAGGKDWVEHQMKLDRTEAQQRAKILNALPLAASRNVFLTHHSGKQPRPTPHGPDAGRSILSGGRGLARGQGRWSYVNSNRAMLDDARRVKPRASAMGRPQATEFVVGEPSSPRTNAQVAAEASKARARAAKARLGSATPAAEHNGADKGVTFAPLAAEPALKTSPFLQRFLGPGAGSVVSPGSSSPPRSPGLHGVASTPPLQPPSPEEALDRGSELAAQWLVHDDRKAAERMGLTVPKRRQREVERRREHGRDRDRDGRRKRKDHGRRHKSRSTSRTRSGGR